MPAMLTGLCLGLGLLPSQTAHAQMFGLYLPMRPPVHAYAMPTHPMPFREVALMLHGFGFRDIGAIQPRGETYRVAAVDRAGVPVSILLDAYEGDILDVRPQNALPRGNGLARPDAGPNFLQGTVPRQGMAPKPPQRPGSLAALPQNPASLAKPGLKLPVYPPAEPEVLRGLATGKR